MMWQTKKEREEVESIKLDLIVLQTSLDKLEKQYAELLLVSKTPESITEYKEKTLELEVKMAKIWSALIGVTPTGKDKPSKLGRRIGQELH
jgi:hypothetical protein